MQSFDKTNTPYASNYLIKSRFDGKGDSRFYLHVVNNNDDQTPYQTSVDHAYYADKANGVGYTDNKYDQMHVRPHIGTPSHPVNGGLFMTADMGNRRVEIGIDGIGSCPVIMAYGDKYGNDIAATYMPRSWTTYASEITNQGKVNLHDLCSNTDGFREIHIVVKATLSNGVDYTNVKTMLLSDININASTDHKLIFMIGGGWHNASFNQYCEIMIYNYQLHLSAYTINGEDHRTDARMWVLYR